MLEHGGRLREAARRYGIPLADWLDLSTGISPHAYPVPPVPAAAWQRLPEDDDPLAAVAARYYGSAELLAVPGSQAAIQALPALVPGERVTVLAPTYAEHPHAWRERSVRACPGAELDDAIDATDVLVLVQPNNPTGQQFTRERLLGWHARLAPRGGWLIVDEAFIDADPAESLAGLAGRPNLVVLRSLGKFFGLAGARVGFVLAPADLRARLAEHLGPWPLSGPVRHVAAAALGDLDWQRATRARLSAGARRLSELLDATGLGPTTGTPLFRWVRRADACKVQDCLARHGILVRRFDAPASLRFGLPPDEAGWSRLADALATL